MSGERSALVVGGTAGLGKEVAKRLLARCERVTIAGHDEARAKAVAGEIGAWALAVDLARPEEVAGCLSSLDRVDHLVIASIVRDENSVRKYDVASATALATMKLVGYTAVVHALVPRFTADASIVLFGGQARARPYPGSTTVTTVNGAVSSLIRALAVELAPIRVNAVHPGVVGDSPAWREKPPEAVEPIRARTPSGRLATMEDVSHAVLFLLDNRGVNGVNLEVDGGWLLL